MSNRFEKEPDETFVVEGSVYKVLSSGDVVSLASCDVTARDRANRDASSAVVDAGSFALGNDARGGTSNTLKARILGGTETRSPYTLTFKIVTQAGDTFIVRGKMVVKRTSFVVSTTTTTSTTTSTTSP